MAKIVDPDNLVRASTFANLGTDGNIYIQTGAGLERRIALAAFGSLTDTSMVDGGVSLQAIYSYLKEEWKNDDALIKFPFPMIAITPEQFEFVDGWEPCGTTTINLFRDGGFAITSAGTTWEEWAGIISLGSVGESQLYYQRRRGETGTTAVIPSDFSLTGAANQPVQLYSHPSRGNFDYRTGTTQKFFTVFAREQGDLYDQADNSDIGVSTFTYQAYRFPVNTSADLKITVPDTGITWSGDIGLTYYSVGQQRTVGSNTYDFDVIIDGSGQSIQNIYTEIQRRLRLDTDIDDGPGVVSGRTADPLLTFVGDTLVTSTGVFIDNLNPSDINSVDFYETGGTVVRFPFVAAGTLTFNDNLSNDAFAIYRVFFTNDDAGDNSGADFGTVNAVLVYSNDIVEDSTTISFDAASNKILDSASGLGSIDAQRYIRVSGSTSNDGFYTVIAADPGALTVDGTLTNETAGSLVDIIELIAGNVSGASSISFTYDYDFNTQRGPASSGTNVPVTVVGIGLDTAQYVSSTGTISRSNANTLSLVAALERNYSNPA